MNLILQIIKSCSTCPDIQVLVSITLAGVGPRWAELGTFGNRMTSINHSRDHPEIAQRDPIPPNRSLNVPNHTRGRPIRPTDFSLGMNLNFKKESAKIRGTSFYRGTTVRPVRAVAPVPRQTYLFQVFARFTRLELGPDTSPLQINAEIIMFA